MKAIDIFCGAGGFSSGISMAGFDVIFSNEIEPVFAESYKKNHPKTKIINKDIHDVDFKIELQKYNLQNIDLLFGGPPCQGFSTLGKKNEYDDRNSLFWQYLRCVEETNPNFLIFENVSGFKKLYKGRMFDILIEELSRLGYRVKYKILDAFDYGVPQHRFRTIVVGYKPYYSFDFPEPMQNTLTLWDAISDLPSILAGQSSNSYLEAKNQYQLFMRKDNKILTEHLAPKHGKKLLYMISHVPKGGSILDIPEELRPKSYFKNTYARLVEDKPSPTITRNFSTPSSSRCIHPFLDRGLTTREGARLQSFSDNYIFCGSTSEKNLQIGNAVPPLLAYHLGLKIMKSFLQFYQNRDEIA